MTIKIFKTSILTAMIAVPLLLSSGLAEASPVHRNDYHGSHDPYRPGAHHRSLPHSYNIVWIDNHKYYHHDHVYYKQADDGYVVVEVPATFVATTNSPMYVYPAAGQSPEQQRQDRYECHVWASDQTGFDPSNVTSSVTTERVYVDQRRRHDDNSEIVDGAVGGAAVGALGGAITGDPGVGAAVGAGLGVLTSAIFHSNENQRAKPVAVNRTVTNSNTNQGKANYDRAITACLEARHYTVK